MLVSATSVNNPQVQYLLPQTKIVGSEHSTPRQDVAASTIEKTDTQTQSRSESTSHSESQIKAESQIKSQHQENFLNQLMEQMLANRIGLDKQKYDEIKQKIEEIEREKTTLAEQEQSPARDSKIALLEGKQEQLNQALVDLVEQAQRNREQNERTEQAKANLIDNYRTAAYNQPNPAIIL